MAGTFGGVIRTPTLDQIAADGLSCTQFHSTALCSPTRAALITGRNHHSAGFGVIAEHHRVSRHNSIIGADNATVGNILKDHGYATSWFGKNDNTPTCAYSTPGPFDQWPSGMGFDYFYGLIGGESDQCAPWLFRDHTRQADVAFTDARRPQAARNGSASPVKTAARRPTSAGSPVVR